LGKRTKARECAFQILYQCEITGDPIDRAVEQFWKIRSGTDEARAMAERLARGTHAATAELDALIVEFAKNWRLERIASVDKCVLRLGAYELKHQATPVAVVLDEAVELAKRFGEADSPPFVNGVLDAIMRKVRPKA